MHDHHREHPGVPVKTWRPVIVELGEVVNENPPEVGDFSDELGNIVVLLPSELGVRGGTPSGPLLDFRTEGFRQASVQVIQDLGDMVLELDQSQLVSGGHGGVQADGHHPFGDNSLATVGQKIRQMTADDLLFG